MKFTWHEEKQRQEAQTFFDSKGWAIKGAARLEGERSERDFASAKGATATQKRSLRNAHPPAQCSGPPNTSCNPMAQHQNSPNCVYNLTSNLVRSA